MNVLRRYFTLLSVLLLMRLVTACSNGSTGPSASDRGSADPTGCVDDDSTGTDDDDSGGDDQDEPGDVDCGDDED